MVDGISDEERERFAVKVKAGFVLLVGLSAGLITLYADAGPELFLGASAIGLAIGTLLVWWVFPARGDLERASSGRGRR